MNAWLDAMVYQCKRGVAVTGLALGMVTLCGCSRHVVLDPSDVAAHNQAQWQVRSAPAASAKAAEVSRAASPPP